VHANMAETTGSQNQPDTSEMVQSESTKKKPKIKAILLAILVVVLLLAGGTGLYYLNQSRLYFSTDNAKVTAKMYNINPSLSGELLEWRAAEGDRVEKNEILGRQEVLPYITSPINGTIIKNNGVVGEIVNPTTQLAVVADTDNLYIGVNIEETDIMKIRLGQAVDVKIDAYPGKTFPGVVDDIDRTTQTYFSSPSSFSTSGTYTKVTQLIPVKVLIANEENLPLTFGMNGTVKIHLQDQPTGTPASTKTGAGDNQVVEYSSYIEAAEQIAVAPNVAAKVSRINVAVGQRVHQGDTLFVLDGTDLELQVRQATATYNSAVSNYQSTLHTYNSKASIVPAQTAYQDAAASYARLQTLYIEGAISQVELDEAKTKLDSTQAQLQTAEQTAQSALDAAKAQMEGARAVLAIAQKKLGDCVVKAPMSGEVAAKDIAVGDMASPQTAAVTLINAQKVKVPIKVTETHIATVHIGTKAEIKVQAMNLIRTGTVQSIAPASDAKTGMFPVEILVDNADGRLKPGMITDVKLLNE